MENYHLHLFTWALQYLSVSLSWVHSFLMQLVWEEAGAVTDQLISWAEIMSLTRAFTLIDRKGERPFPTVFLASAILNLLGWIPSLPAMCLCLRGLCCCPLCVQGQLSPIPGSLPAVPSKEMHLNQVTYSPNQKGNNVYNLESFPGPSSLGGWGGGNTNESH